MENKDIQKIFEESFKKLSIKDMLMEILLEGEYSFIKMMWENEEKIMENSSWEYIEKNDSLKLRTSEIATIKNWINARGLTENDVTLTECPDCGALMALTVINGKAVIFFSSHRC